MKQVRVLIAGAGLAGLAQALALAQRGHRVIVIEKSERLSPIGAGIQLGPNGQAPLQALGVLSAVERHACHPPQVSIRAWRSGKLISRMSHEAVKQRYGYAPLTVHRADLQTALFEACQQQAGIQIHLNQPLNNQAVHTQWNTDVLIGADGLWSQARQLVGDTAAPRYSGKLAFRALLDMNQVPAAMQTDIGLWLGPNAHIVHYPVSAGRQLNLVIMWRDAATATEFSQTQPFANWGVEQATSPAIEQMRHQLRTACEPIEQLLQRCQSGSVWRLYDRPAQVPWHSGTTCLIGDAAHPMQAHLAQGAAMAFEDAIVMARCLGTQDSYEQDFTVFTQQRFTRTAQAQRRAAAYGKIYQASGFTALARNIFLASPLAKANSNGLAWLYQGAAQGAR